MQPFAFCLLVIGVLATRADAWGLHQQTPNVSMRSTVKSCLLKPSNPVSVFAAYVCSNFIDPWVVLLCCALIFS